MSCNCEAALAAALGARNLFDAGVEAARNACVAGASLAAAAITASAYYDNPLSGARALRECLSLLGDLPFELGAWQRAFAPKTHPETGDAGYAPGFGFVSEPEACAVIEVAERLLVTRSDCTQSNRLGFFLARRSNIGVLNVAGLCALHCVDHGVTLDAAERIFLLRRVDVAVSEAAAARARGLAKFPFFTNEYVYEGSTPALKTLDLAALMREVGL